MPNPHKTLRQAVAQCANFRTWGKTCHDDKRCRVLLGQSCRWFERAVLPQCAEAVQEAYRTRQACAGATRLGRRGRMVTRTLFQEGDA